MLKFAARASTHTHTRIWPLIELGGYLIQFVTPPTHVVIAIGYRPDDIGSPSQMIYEGKVGTMHINTHTHKMAVIRQDDLIACEKLMFSTTLSQVRLHATIACLCPDNGVALTPDIHRIGCCYFYIVLTGIVRHSLDNVS